MFTDSSGERTAFVFRIEVLDQSSAFDITADCLFYTLIVMLPYSPIADHIEMLMLSSSPVTDLIEIVLLPSNPLADFIEIVMLSSNPVAHLTEFSNPIVDFL
jgi:hypothetical protein